MGVDPTWHNVTPNNGKEIYISTKLCSNSLELGTRKGHIGYTVKIYICHCTVGEICGWLNRDAIFATVLSSSRGQRDSLKNLCRVGSGWVETAQIEGFDECQGETAKSKDTGRLEAVVTTPSPASYCIDPFPLVLQETESLFADFEASFALALKRHDPSWPYKGPKMWQKGLWSFGGAFCPIGRTKGHGKDRGTRGSV